MADRRKPGFFDTDARQRPDGEYRVSASEGRGTDDSSRARRRSGALVIELLPKLAILLFLPKPILRTVTARSWVRLTAQRWDRLCLRAIRPAT
jgi:hypothetical protein